MVADTSHALERLLEPVAHSMNGESLKQLVDLRADSDLQTRMEFLAEKNTEGTLSPEEKEQYELLVHAMHVIGILQAKARKLLTANPAR